MEEKQLPEFASSLNDKVLILQARDKYVRSHRIKQTNIETAKLVTGLCLDMCPEYERYCRLDRNLVSNLEKTNNQPDEHKMVKEFVRSSADQDEPLPYELRSPECLERTLLYLATNIFDLIDNDDCLIGEWYDFLWNRLRAIRKDITQQNLTSKSMVLLMERCVRFHIYSAHRLIEEDSNNFDVKINNENLSKSLITLKDFYHDLSLRGIECENEPEFRCYDILLNLFNIEGDILLELSRLKVKIRDSDRVKFGIKVYIAYKNNNFVKFFSLIREANYLEACLMHRYFDDMRLKAIQLLRRACIVKDQKELFPIDSLYEQLCFQDDKEFEDFCDQMKLEIESNYKNVILDRVNLDNDKIQFIPKQSLLYIEPKRQNRKLSEIIYNEKIGDNPYKKYPLYNSFDEMGNLIKKDVKLDDDLIVKIDYDLINKFNDKIQATNLLANKIEPVTSITTNKFSSNRDNFKETKFGISTKANVFGLKSSSIGNTAYNNDLFGKKVSSNVFGIPSNKEQPSNLFGIPSNKEQSSNLFGIPSNKEQSSNLFGIPSNKEQSSNLFGIPSNKEQLNESFHFKLPPSSDSTSINNSNLFSADRQQFTFKVPTEQQEESIKKENETKKLDDKQLTELSSDLLDNLLDDHLKRQIKNSFLDILITEESIKFTNSLMTEVVLKMISEQCEITLKSEKLKQEQLRRLIIMMTNELNNKIIDEVLNDSIKSISKSIYIEDLNKFIHLKSELFANSYFNETIDQMVFEICSQTLETELLNYQRIINYIKTKRGWRLAGNYFRYWKKRCDYLKKYRFLKANFPASNLENTPPTLKRVLSVPELMNYEPNKRKLINEHDSTNYNTNNYNKNINYSNYNLNKQLIRSTTEISLIDFSENLKLNKEIKELDERKKNLEKNNEQSLKSKLEYARKSLDNLKKVNKTFHESLNYVKPFLSFKK